MSDEEHVHSLEDEVVNIARGSTSNSVRGEAERALWCNLNGVHCLSSSEGRKEGNSESGVNHLGVVDERSCRQKKIGS